MQNKKYNLEYLITTFFFSGYLPKAPGTWGTLASLIVLFIPNNIFLLSLIIIILLVLFISIPLINKIENIEGSDPSFIVIDEAIGMWFILLFPISTFNNFYLILSIILFRIFDICKPFPINLLNKKQGGIYVILDDLLASVYALVCLYSIYFINQLL